MSAQEMVRLEVAGMKIKVPQPLVLQLVLDSLNQKPAVQMPFEIPRIGEAWPDQGGVNGGLMRGVNGNPDYFIIVPTAPEAYIEKITYGGYEKDDSGAACEFDGLANTLALCESKHDHPAAQWARGLTIEGHSDLYLMSRRESAVVYGNVPELFEKRWHWTSTQYSSYLAWVQHFEYGGQDDSAKLNEYAARAVRRLVIQ